ncbi:hypothetical protein GCM10028807_23690 [Spirosoma daeguense]
MKFTGLIAWVMWLTMGVDSQAAPRKKALLIGIANYATAGLGWGNLPVDRDLGLMRQILSEQGFNQPNSIQTITNGAATYKGINEKFRQFIDELATGDLVIVHFAGHGQQISDNNGDEKDDAWDECFVPFDAPVSLKIAPKYLGEKHIRDDLIGMWIRDIRQRIGPGGHLLLLMDTCYSGDISRGELSVRGGEPPIRLPYHKTLTATGTNTTDYSDYLERGGTSSTRAGRFVLITASEKNELNANAKDELGKPIGALTYAFSRAVRQLKSNDSYRKLFNKIATFIAEQSTTQNPTLEGDADVAVFGGNFIDRKTGLRLTDVSKISQRLVEVTGGYASAIFERASMAFYSSEQNRGGAPMAIGRVVESSLTHSVVAIDSGVVQGNLDSIRVIEKEKAFGNWQIKVSFSPRLSTALHQSLTETLTAKQAIRIQNKGSDIQIDQRNNFVLLRMTDTYQHFDSIPLDSPDIAAFCLHRILNYGQAKLLRGLTLNNDQYAIQAELLPVLTDPTGQFVVDTVKRLLTGTFPRFPTNVQGQLTVFNEGKQDIFITLIDISPDGRLAVLLPDASSTGQEKGIRIRTGQRSEPILFRFYPPYGTEVYKLIATPSPLPVETTVRSGGDMVTDSDNPVIQLFNSTYRGESPRKIPLSEGATTTITFQITPPLR